MVLRVHLGPLKKLPWWPPAALLLAVLGAWSLTSRSAHRLILTAAASGLGVTLVVSLVSFVLAAALGPSLAVRAMEARLGRHRAHVDSLR